VATNGYIHDDVKWKIVDVPELGYSAQDKPCPRGELYVITPLMIHVYLVLIVV
jgi:hypothetical protein